jgi:hypothetical protein
MNLLLFRSWLWIARLDWALVLIFVTASVLG